MGWRITLEWSSKERHRSAVWETATAIDKAKEREGERDSSMERKAKRKITFVQ